MKRFVYRCLSRKMIRLITGLSLIIILLVNILIFSQSGIRYDTVIPDYNFDHQMEVKDKINLMTIPDQINRGVLLNVKRPKEISRNTSASIIPEQKFNLTLIKNIVNTINLEQLIVNHDKLDLNLVKNVNSVALLVQIHNRPAYLRHLIRSLARAKGIENTLVIFSHDYYSEELMAITKSIDAFPVIQIFYPYSMQLYPTVFPGEDPNDCPRNLPKLKALKKGCNNAAHPDKYGHYREAKYTQTKHHWFWKMNYVFNKLDVMRDFKGYLLLLEEDHFVSEDFLYVFDKLRTHRDQTCTDCSILTIGNYDKKPTFLPTSGKVELSLWISAKHNMGMAFNRGTWEKIHECSQAFCNFDDYNWDWTLQYVGMKCVKGRLKVMVLRSPRVFHIGECGVHHKGKVCLPDTRVAQLDKLLQVNRGYLYPDNLVTIGWSRFQARLPKPNGGWGDIRDHKLCLSFTKKT